MRNRVMVESEETSMLQIWGATMKEGQNGMPDEKIKGSREEERRLKSLAKLEAEKERMWAMFSYEREFAAYSAIGGVDEVGRGPVAGPVLACVVILPKDCDLLYLNDSKKLSAKKREELYPQILACAKGVGIGSASPARIDAINILQATYEAMRQAIESCPVQPDLLLNDAVTIPGLSMRQVPIVKGDQKSASIAAASIIAKVTRDRLMEEFDAIYPGYGFAAHKGYPTAAHREALSSLGPCPIHRLSFLPHFLGQTAKREA